MLESWPVRQRWRALSATAFAKGVGPYLWEEEVRQLASRLIQMASIHYPLEKETRTKLHGEVVEGLLKLYTMAHELSLIMKRDVLSVKLSVIGSASGAFNSRSSTALWDSADMASINGDIIIGCYSLGLFKYTKDDRSGSFMLLPKVITSALLRYVGVDTPSEPDA